jgi:hypothetical protein
MPLTIALRLQISQFVDVTGATVEQAHQFLDASNGDAALAISSFFEAQTAQGDTEDDVPMEQSDIPLPPPSSSAPPPAPRPR